VREAESVCISKSTEIVGDDDFLELQAKMGGSSKAGHSSELFLFAKKLASSAS
jgi:hypothetical protein